MFQPSGVWHERHGLSENLDPCGEEWHGLQSPKSFVENTMGRFAVLFAAPSWHFAQSSGLCRPTRAYFVFAWSKAPAGFQESVEWHDWQSGLRLPRCLSGWHELHR
jgi:hypothetical protein